MGKDFIAYVTKVEQLIEEEPPTEDRSNDPLVPDVSGGTMAVTAECEDGTVTFRADMNEHLWVGKEVHVRLDYVIGEVAPNAAV